MILIGRDLLERVLAGECSGAKPVLNFSGAICFPMEQQHRDQRAAGLCYADESAGNALAAVIRPGKIEIRLHSNFSDVAVAGLIRQLCAQPGLAGLRDWDHSYHGRQLPQ